jgi:hypothetical protein
VLFGYLALIVEEENPVSFLGGSIGYELALTFQSLTGYGTFLFLGLGLLIFIVYSFNITEFGKTELTEAKKSTKEKKQPVLEEEDALEEPEEDPLIEELVEDEDSSQDWVIKKNIPEPKKKEPTGLELQIDPIEEAVAPLLRPERQILPSK